MINKFRKYWQSVSKGFLTEALKYFALIIIGALSYFVASSFTRVGDTVSNSKQVKDHETRIVVLENEIDKKVGITRFSAYKIWDSRKQDSVWISVNTQNLKMDHFMEVTAAYVENIDQRTSDTRDDIRTIKEDQNSIKQDVRQLRNKHTPQ